MNKCQIHATTKYGRLTRLYSEIMWKTQKLCERRYWNYDQLADFVTWWFSTFKVESEKAPLANMPWKEIFYLFFLMKHDMEGFKPKINPIGQEDYPRFTF